jgi:predicted Zn-dependent protease
LYPGEVTLIQPYAMSLMAAGNSEAAYTLLSNSSSDTPGNSKTFKLLAQAAGETGHRVQTHTAMAEYYFLNGFTLQAIEQMKLAGKAPGLSNYQAARIQARLSSFEKQLEAEKLE